MPLFLTTVLPFLAHDHASAVAFLTCRHHNFHGSIIPEFLSDEERAKRFCEARQRNDLEAHFGKQYANLYNLFVQTPLMQFSPSLTVCQYDFARSILEPLLETKYFTRTLQRCVVVYSVPLSKELLQALSKVRSLTELDLGTSTVENEHLEIIVNSFPSLETLTIYNAGHLKIGTPSELAIKVSSPPPPATKTLRCLMLRWADPLFAAHFVPLFTNLRKLVLFGNALCSKLLNLHRLSSSLPLLTDLSVAFFTLAGTKSLKKLQHLSSIAFRSCRMLDSFSFLTQDILPELGTLSLVNCTELSPSSFGSLSNTPNLHVLEVNSDEFDNHSLQYLENMVHLRKLVLSRTNITGDKRLFDTLIKNSFQLEELNLKQNHIGHQGAIAGALSNTHTRLRVLNLSECSLVDDDLNGIGALKNTLEVLDLSVNRKLTNEALMHCKDLVKLKILHLRRSGIDDLSPLKHCLNLAGLDVSGCDALTDDSFKVFSEEPNSFPNLHLLKLEYCDKLTEKVFEHLAKNIHLLCQLKELNVEGLSEILASSPTARNNICQLRGLRRLTGCFSEVKSHSDLIKLKGELMQGLKNLEEIR